ncbi:MAG TPA: SDR family oxidoreductase [Bauldia sp.]|nr:SDR family oxidoreductase [Bauldia sp.]
MSKVALVTGGGSGIGKALALGLARAGYAVAIAGRRAEPLETVAREIGSGALAVPTDVGDPKAVSALFAKVKRTFGRLDLLFNNAGVGLSLPIDEITFEQWQTSVAANLTGPFLCTQEAVRLMKAQSPQGGRIINNGSISAHVPRPNMAPYTATKHAITGLTRATALEGRQWNIACGQIDIGNAATDMTTRMQTGALQANGTTASEPRMDVSNVVSAVLYMAGLPLDANVLFMTVMATTMPYVGRG